MVQDGPRKSNEANFMALLNFIVDPAAIIDKKGRFLAVNDAFVDLIGLRSKKKLIGMMFLDLDVLDTKNKAKVLKNFGKRMQGLHIDPYEINFTDKTGKDRCVELKARKINYSGQPADLVLLHDITRRKENARKLGEYSEKMEALVNAKVREIKENKEKLETIFNSSPDAITLCDLNGKIIECNEATLNLLGYSSKQELIGKNAFEMVAPKDQPKATLLMESLSKYGSVKNHELTYLNKDSKEFLVEASASIIKDDAGNPVGLVAIAENITERKKSEEALKESEEKFRNLSEESPNMIFINKQGRVVYANKRCEDLMGYTKEEFYAPTFNFFSLIAPESLKKLNSSYSTHRAGEEVDPYEYNLLTKAGKRISAVITSKLIKYDGERAILGIVTDITERKQLENAWRESEKMFRGISTSAMDAIILLDDEAKITYWNPAAEKIFGYTNEEAVGKKLDNLIIPPQYQGIHSKTVINRFQKGQNHKIESKALRKNRTEVPIEVSVTTVEIKNKKHMLGIIRDITERKKAEAKLLASEKKYRQLFEELKLAEKQLVEERDRAQGYLNVANVMLVALDTEGRVTLLNRKGCDVLKCTAEEALGKSWFETFLPKDAKDNVKKIFQSLIKGKHPIEYNENCVISKSGKAYLIAWHNTLLRNSMGQIIGTLSSGEDITERKLMENKLAEYSQKLEKLVEKRTEQLKQTQAKLVKSERLAAIGELAAMVGHDLRNPLTGIKGATYYLKTKHGADIGVKGKEMLETIERAINYSNKIINDLLDYSRDQKLDLAEVTPKALLKNALSLLEVPDKIQVVDATENEPRVKADMEKMHRVFVNIIKNAIDAMPEGGTLTIKSREARGKLKIIFKDTGAGMSEETLTTLKRGVPLFSTKAKGMGFGLPICKRIIEAHGGKIAVESKIGKGTKVTVTIPVNPKPAKEGEEKWIVSEPMLPTITTAQKNNMNAEVLG